MGRYQQATARQLDFDSGDDSADFTPVAGREHRVSRPVPLCVVCGRHPANLTLTRQHGHAPAKLCLRCHHAVVQHRKMLRADLSSVDLAVSTSPHSARTHHLSGDVGLIVPPGQRLTAEARHAALDHRRRRAQVAARRALDLLDCVG